MKKQQIPDHTVPPAPETKQHDCDDGHRAQWSAELSSYNRGSLLAAFLRGLTSGVANAATKFILDQIDIDQ